MIIWATWWTFRRRFMACCWMNRQACCSVRLWLSISWPLARSISRRASSRSARSPTSRSRATSSEYRPEGHLDGRDEVALLERLHQVGEGAGVAGLLDQVALGEGGEDEDGGAALAGDVAGGRQPVHPRHLDVEDGEVGVEVADELDGLVAPAGLADDFVALFFEQLLQVEADDGLVLGDHDARGVVFTGWRSGGWSGLRGQLVGHPVEEGVLLAEQLGQGGLQGLAVPGHRLGVPPGLTGLGVAQRGLGDQRPQAGLLALLLEETSAVRPRRRARRAPA